MSRIQATYRLAGDADEAAVRARAIAYEQTVELPADLVTDPAIVDRVVGDVVALEPAPGVAGAFDARLAFETDLACGQLSQLLNLVFGNVSLWPGVRLVDLRLPDELLAELPGPGHGIAGVRAALGVEKRPLLATAIKPRGLSIEGMATLAADFVRGGGDLVKDDQNLNDRTHADWYERVARCAEAVEGVRARDGAHGLYFPHVAGPSSEMEKRLDDVVRLGLRGVLASPYILGLDHTAGLVRRRGLILLAHPALSGSAMIGEDHGMEPWILLGLLFRLAGADVSIFPNARGRFRFGREQCLRLAEVLRAPLGGHRPALPAPAGGMDYDRLDDMAEDYGADSVFLVGGALLGADAGVEAETRRYLERIRARFGETRRGATSFVSACELPPDPSTVARIVEHLRFDGAFGWDGRTSTRYKDDDTLTHRGVRRVELVGQHGEATAFDLRYFEVEPGGFTSLEKHLHTHTIIAARGEGVLVRGQERQEMAHLDVAYVGPLEVHQLRNEGREPFGFFCIVDHERDRPQAP